MPPTDAPPSAELETIHYTLTAHGTLRVTKDPQKKKPHKHRRRHRNRGDPSDVEKPKNEGIETGLQTHMTPGPPHASAAASMIMPVSQRHAHLAAMHIPEPSLERAAPQAITTTSKQGAYRYRRPRAGTIFPLLSWDEIWAEEKPDSNHPYRTKQNLSTVAPAQTSATGNAQKTGQANESASAEPVSEGLVKLPARLTRAFQHPESNDSSTEGTNISCELPTRTRGNPKNQTNGHGHPTVGSSSGPPVPPPHRIRRQTLGPLLLSIQVGDYDQVSSRSDVEYEVSGQETLKRGETSYRLQERYPRGDLSRPNDSATLENLNRADRNLKNLESHVNDPPTNKGLTSQPRQTEFGQGPSYKSMEYGRVEPSAGDSAPRQGPQLRKSTWLSPPPLHQCRELMPNNKQKAISVQTMPTRDAPRFEENTSSFKSPSSTYTLDTPNAIPHDIEETRHKGTPVVRDSKAKPVTLTTRNNYPHVRFSSVGSTSYASPSHHEATLQESPRGGNNTPSTYVRTPVRMPQDQALTPVTPTRLPKGPAQIFEGIVDLDPGVTLFNTATAVVKCDISPKVALGNSTSARRMLRTWNQKTSNDSEMKGLCEAEMKRLQRN